MPIPNTCLSFHEFQENIRGWIGSFVTQNTPPLDPKIVADVVWITKVCFFQRLILETFWMIYCRTSCWSAYRLYHNTILELAVGFGHPSVAEVFYHSLPSCFTNVLTMTDISFSCQNSIEVSITLSQPLPSWKIIWSSILWSSTEP